MSRSGIPEKVLVVDLEATCWEGKAPAGEFQEIIEFGWAILNLTGKKPVIDDSGSILVKPIRSCVSAFCAQLTTLTQEQVDTGVTYAEACRILTEDIGSKSMPWASYGDWDRKTVRQQCGIFDVDYPFAEQHTNVKEAFAKKKGMSRRVGMAGALNILKRPLIGVHHRGVDDAKNIAVILGDIWGTQQTKSILDS